MKFKKRIFTVILSFLLLVSFAACGNSKEGPGTPAPSDDNGANKADSETATETPAAEGDDDKAPEVKDLGSFTVVVSDWTGGNMEIESENKLVFDEISKRLLEERNEKVLINVRSYPGQNFQEKLNTLLAGNEDIDAFSIWYPWNTFVSYAEKPGLVKRITSDLENYPTLKSFIPEDGWKAVTLNGEICGLPDYQNKQSYCLFVRKDILDSAGVPVPSTIDEMTNALAAITTAGKVGLYDEMQGLIRLIGGAYALPMYNYLDENGMVMDRLFHPNLPDYLQLLNEWYQKGYLAKDFDSATMEQLKANFVSGISGIYSNAPQNVIGDYAKLLEAEPNAEIALVPVLTAVPDGGLVAEENVKNVFFILEKSKNADAILAFFDWRYSSLENNMLVYSGVNGIHYNADFEKFTNSPSTIYKDSDQKPYAATYGFQMQVTPLFHALKTIASDPAAQAAYDLNYTARQQLQNANYIYSPTLGSPIAMTDEMESIAAEFEAKKPLEIEMIMGKKTVEQFKEEVERMREIYAPLSQHYTDEIKNNK